MEIKVEKNESIRPVEKEPLAMTAGKGETIEKPETGSEFTQVRQGEGAKIYDMGESIVSKMNRGRAAIDKDDYFQNLYENWLCCVERNEMRQRPDSRIITRWDMSTTFDDFLSDAVFNLDKQIDSIKMAKASEATRFNTIGDSVLSDIKLDKGSSVVGKKFDGEDYDALYEILMRSRELLLDYKAGRLLLVINSQTGRVRMTGNVA